MSAYVVDPETIKALVVFATQRRYGRSYNVDPRYLKTYHPDAEAWYYEPHLAERYAEVLWRQNIRSVLTRYPDDIWDTMPGPSDPPAVITITPADELRLSNITALTILKACDCLEYQSCETEDYEQTFAYKLLDKIRGAAIRALPGYDDAPWGLELVAV